MERNTVNSLIVSYYLSRRDKEGLEMLGYKSFSDAYEQIGKIIGENPNNLKNMRDEFDPLFPNKRKGWYQRPLRPSRQRVFDFFSKMSDSELDEFVKQLLNGKSMDSDIYIQLSNADENNESKDEEKLRDLGELVKESQIDLMNNFSPQDTTLSSQFKESYSRITEKNGSKIIFKKATTIITNTQGLNTYIANQWFVIAKYAVDLVKEIIVYKTHTESIISEYGNDIRDINGEGLERDKIYKGLKENADNSLRDSFTEATVKYFKKRHRDETIVQHNTSMIIRFVTDYKWWLGGKGIERTNDYYMSPALGVLQLVNASQSYVSTLVYQYATIPELYNLLETMTLVGDTQNAADESLNEYERAAKIIKTHIDESGVDFRYSTEEVDSICAEFLEKFAPDKLAAISDDEILKTLFYSNDSNNDSLCYELEFNPQIRDMFGSIAGGSSYKFGLFQRKEEGVWVTGSGTKPEELTEQEAIELGKSIRDAIITGAEIIGRTQVNTREDYENLDVELNEKIGKYATYGWIQKYYQMLYPDKLVNFYSSDWLNHLLYALEIGPSSKYYARNGQLAIVKRLTGLSATDFADAVVSRFGSPKRFIRIGSSIDGVNAAEEWLQRNIVAIGWSELGSLEDFRQGNSLNRKALAETLAEKYYPDDASTSSRKAGEIQEFFNANKDAIFVVMDGEKTIALVDGIGDYYYDAQNPLRSHCKPGEWHQCFSQDEELPVKSEGKLTTCFEIKKAENLLYLYKKYYYELEEVGDNAMNKEMPYIPLKYHTGIRSPFAANRIMFGAPGTGKSFNLEQDRKEVLQDGLVGGYERVTFHPDYTYSQFVGTYKPVTDRTGNISYQFVPGPFMRVYVEALRNGRTDKPEPFILLIEEINRANVAAVFGDVFQLLDRDGSNVSEYPIQATEDIRNYFASQLGGTADNYMEIQIPDNMFIWATMNSADQGVFPMDTAFKRRWDFTYLGIDNGEDKIAGKTVVLGKGEHKRNVEWNALRKEINQVLLNDCKVNEDKLMGPFFIAMKNLPEGNEIDAESFTRIFKNKVIMYLFDDAAKQKRPTLFDGCDIKNLYSAICEEFDEKGVDIFSESVRSAFPVSADEDEE